MFRIGLTTFALGSLVLAAAACEANPTSQCFYELSHQNVSLKVGEQLAVFNQSGCVSAEEKTPISYTGKHPDVLTVTPLPGFKTVNLTGVGPGADTVTARFSGGQAIVIFVQVSR